MNAEPDEKHEFLLRAGGLLQKYGTPSHRLERVMQRLSEAIGVKAAYLYTPTSLVVSFGEGKQEHTRLLRTDAGDTDLGKLIDFDEVLEDVEHERCGIAEAMERLAAIDQAPPRYGTWASALAFAVGSAGATVFLGGGWREVVTSLVLGGVIFAIGWLLHRLPTSTGLFEPVAGFVAAALAIVASSLFPPLDDRLTTLGSLIILLPGLSFTVAMTELASRHLSAGVARMAGTGVSFFTLTLGVALAWRLFQEWRPVEAGLEPLPGWATALALVFCPIAFAVLFQARWQEWWIISFVAVLSFIAAKLGGQSLGPEFGPFMGALAVGLISNGYARWLDRPASIPSTPGILILVPGSIGYRSLTALVNQNTLEGIELAFTTVLVAMSLVGGLLAANVILPPKRIL